VTKNVIGVWLFIIAVVGLAGSGIQLPGWMAIILRIGVWLLPVAIAWLVLRYAIKCWLAYDRARRHQLRDEKLGIYHPKKKFFLLARTIVFILVALGLNWFFMLFGALLFGGNGSDSGLVVLIVVCAALALTGAWYVAKAAERFLQRG
jgi:hypothetical protein